MATIDDLNKSILEMTPGELYERLREIRLSRRTSKSPRKSKAKRREPKLNLKSMVEGMSSEMKRKLIEELEGLDGAGEMSEGTS